MTKFLGVWLDSKLSWNEHMSKLFIKLKRSLSMLKLSQNFLSPHVKKCLYYAQIFSHLSYGILIWGNMLKQTQLTKLKSMQNKCFKLVLKLEPTPKNYHAQKMLRITNLIMLVNMKHGHQVQHSHLPVRILSTTRTDSVNKSLVKSHPYRTRHKNSLNLPQNPNHGISLVFITIPSWTTTPSHPLSKII